MTHLEKKCEQLGLDIEEATELIFAGNMGCPGCYVNGECPDVFGCIECWDQESGDDK